MAGAPGSPYPGKPGYVYGNPATGYGDLPVPANQSGPAAAPNTAGNTTTAAAPAPQTGQMIQGVSPQQLGGVYQQNQNALTGYGNFVNALQGQNSLGIQSNLANQLQQESMGGGPNPAAAQLALTTGQNSQMQAAMMNSARGGGANPGLMSRNAAMVGAQNQQEAAGQMAMMRAQQQLAAQQQLSGLSSTMAAQQQLGQQQLGQLNLQNQGQFLGALGTQNQQYLTQNLANQGYGMQIAGGALNAAGAGIGYAAQGGGGTGGAYTTPANGGTYNASGNYTPMTPGGEGGFAQGGMVQGYDDGGTISAAPLQAHIPTVMQQEREEAPKSILGQISQPSSEYPGAQSGSSDNGVAQAAGSFAAQAAPMIIAALASKGGYVGGKAKISGDSPQNDTVPAKLSPGEVVIPRSHVGDPKRAAAFLNSLMGWNLRAK